MPLPAQRFPRPPEIRDSGVFIGNTAGQPKEYALRERPVVGTAWQLQAFTLEDLACIMVVGGTTATVEVKVSGSTVLSITGIEDSANVGTKSYTAQLQNPVTVFDTDTISVRIAGRSGTLTFNAVPQVAYA